MTRLFLWNTTHVFLKELLNLSAIWFCNYCITKLIFFTVLHSNDKQGLRIFLIWRHANLGFFWTSFPLRHTCTRVTKGKLFPLRHNCTHVTKRPTPSPLFGGRNLWMIPNKVPPGVHSELSQPESILYL